MWYEYDNFAPLRKHWRESGVKRFIMDRSILVQFLNPRRPVTSWCDGYLQPETRLKKGVLQLRVYFNGSPSYFVWVDENKVFRYG